MNVAGKKEVGEKPARAARGSPYALAHPRSFIVTAAED